jgi:hypothetical protein
VAADDEDSGHTLGHGAVVADQGHTESDREGWLEGILLQDTALAGWPSEAVGSAGAAAGGGPWGRCPSSTLGLRR